jgi:hypothetical protein
MEQRKSRRVVFERGYDAHMMAIDGNLAPILRHRGSVGYRRKLSVESSIKGLPLKEFFLLLSSNGIGISTL